jgi:hypothetical protein
VTPSGAGVLTAIDRTHFRPPKSFSKKRAPQQRRETSGLPVAAVGLFVCSVAPASAPLPTRVDRTTCRGVPGQYTASAARRWRPNVRRTPTTHRRAALSVGMSGFQRKLAELHSLLQSVHLLCLQPDVSHLPLQHGAPLGVSGAHDGSVGAGSARTTVCRGHARRRSQRLP